MKKLALILLTAFVAPAVMAQGSMNFVDFVGPDTQQWDGKNLGSDYISQLWWGTTDDAATFEKITETAYFGATGGEPNVDGAGLFDGGKVVFEGQEGTIYVQQRIIGPDGAGAVGSVFDIALATGGSPVPTIPSEALEVTIVPEPTSFALAGLGAAALMIFRRRK